ncbi:MAG: secD, partial [Herminiimonas sp.]|nr:secD [Herminiimonas sp.]
MNRYPLWKYILIVIALLFGVFYMLPNFFGESPAVQISSAKATVKVDSSVTGLVEQALQKGNLPHHGVTFEPIGSQGSVRVRFADTDTQFKAKALLERELNRDPADPTYLAAYNLVPNTPGWLQSLHAFPMYLGLDLRGGVHFLMQVDTRAVMNKHLQGLQTSVRSVLVDKKIRFAGISRSGSAVEVRFRDPETRAAAKELIASQLSDLVLQDVDEGGEMKLVATLRPEGLKRTVEEAVQQNITTLSKRVNELGVAEPLIQRQGADRIVVQLPGVQDVSRAKDIIGRTATLEVRMVDESVARGTEESAAIPFGSELFKVGKNAPVVLYRDPIITGDYISSASASFDQNQQPAVGIDLNGDGGRRMRDATRNRIGKAMAIVLFEKNRGEVLTVATIRDELGSRFQITGMGSSEAAGDLALLLREQAEDWQAECARKGLVLTLEVAAAPCRLHAGSMRMLIRNLADNAIRYTPAPGELVIRCGQRDGATFLAVADSGPGIPPAMEERVFERFFRLAGAQLPGSGLGLSIVRRIAERHGAQVKLGPGLHG